MADSFGKKETVSIPRKEYSFNGDFDGAYQMRDGNEEGIYVNQGYARSSTSGISLESEGFSFCSALLVQKREGDDAYLGHVSDWNLSDQQYQELDALPPGRYLARFVVGTLSRVDAGLMTNTRVSEFMGRITANGKDVEVGDDIVVDSGDYHWSLCYGPKTRTAKVFTRRDKTVREFPLET